MMFDLLQFIVFMVAIMVHELAHWASYKSMGYESKISLSWAYLGMITECQDKRLRLIDDVVNRSVAILLGAGACLMLGGTVLTASFYLICCCVDLAFLASMSAFKSKGIDLKTKQCDVKMFVKGVELK